MAVGCSSSSKNEHKGGIALSFDDRYVAQWDSLRPLLKKYNTKATFYVTQFGSLSDTEKQILLDLQADGHEIGCHGAMHVGSIDYVLHTSMEAYLRNEIEAELKPMRALGLAPTSFAHPGGQQIWLIDRKLLTYFVLLRDVALSEQNIFSLKFRRPVFAMNEIFYHFDGENRVNALLIDQGANVSFNSIEHGLIRAKNTGSAMMLFGHRPIFKQSKEPYAFSVSFLEKILVRANTMGLQTYTMSELVE